MARYYGTPPVVQDNYYGIEVLQSISILRLQRKEHNTYVVADIFYKQDGTHRFRIK